MIRRIVPAALAAALLASACNPNDQRRPVAVPPLEARATATPEATEARGSTFASASSMERGKEAAGVTAAPALRPASEDEKRDVIASMARVPLAFEKNEGHLPPNVKFFARGPGYGIYLHSPDASLDVIDDESVTSLTVTMKGASAAAEATPEEPLTATVNYFKGNDPSRWQTDIGTFARVRYDEVYPGIDLVYYGQGQKLEYDFVVSPQTSPRAIRLQFGGHQGLRIDDRGDLVLKTDSGELRQLKPVAYQTVGDERMDVEARFIVDGGDVAFQLGSYDATRPLVIDPAVVFSTYVGGDDHEYTDSTPVLGWDIAVDAAGSAYITGETHSPRMPVVSAYEPTIRSNDSDAFVMKFAPNGQNLVYSTYIGGWMRDYARALVLDAAGNAYLCGATESIDFPVTAGVVQPDAALAYDGETTVEGFVVKLSGAGNALGFSTFLGGNGKDIARDIALDPSGNVWVVGATSSLEFPTMDPRMPYGGGESSFVTKLNPTATAVLFSTFWASLSNDYWAQPGASTIAVDPAGNAYVAGVTDQKDFTTTGAFQPQCGLDIENSTFYQPSTAYQIACTEDAFVTKFTNDGNVVYSTYLGGTAADFATAIAVDTDGSAVVVGRTHSNDFPSDTTIGDYNQSFVTKFAPTGALVFSSRIASELKGVAIDSQGRPVLVGQTMTQFPVVGSLVSYGGDYFADEGAVAILNNSGNDVVFGSYLGGIGAFALALDSGDNLYVVGHNSSSCCSAYVEIPIKDAMQARCACAQTTDSFVMKIDADAPATGLSLARVSPRGGSTAATDGTNQEYFSIGRTRSATVPFDASARVFFGGVEAEVQSVNADWISGKTPPHPAGLVDVRVDLAGASATLTNAYRYVTGPLTITEVTPTSGSAAGGTKVTIRGTGFVPGIDVSHSQRTTYISPTEIEIITDAWGAGLTVDVRGINDWGSDATLPAAFTYTGPGLKHILTDHGTTAGGTIVKLVGAGLETSATVRFGGAVATITQVNTDKTVMDVVTPPGTPGFVDVSITDGSATSTLTNAYKYLAPTPTLTSITPPSAPSAGGTSVTLNGSNFLAGSRVFLLRAEASNVTRVSDAALDATTPPNNPGFAQPFVSSPDGQRIYGFSQMFTYEGPQVNGFGPSFGPAAGGTLVNISGSGFVDGATVSFGGVSVPATFIGTGSLSATTPAHALGYAEVRVTNPDGNSGKAVYQFQYVNPGPTITSVSPSSGPVGQITAVTITGTNFVPRTVIAADQQYSAKPLALRNLEYANATTMYGEVYPSRSDSGSYSLMFFAMNPDGQVFRIPAMFNAIAPPAVTSVSPSSGPFSGGTNVTIAGNRFESGATVTFGGVAATGVTFVSATQLTAVTPAHAPGDVEVVVTNPGGTSGSKANAFRYLPPAPTITSFTPGSGAPGTPVTITGTDFTGTTSVSFNGTNAPGFSVTGGGTQITVNVPSGATTGKISVVTPSGTGVSATDFTVLAAAPAVTSVSPNSGPAGGGTAVTINGSAFVSGATVTFGGVAATGIAFVSATQLTAVTPAHATGYVDVVVTNPDTQSGTGTSSFRYLAPPPTVTSFTPTAAPPGGSVTITGTDLTDATSVSFNTTNAPGFVVSPAGTQITVNVPAGATTGKISVVTPSGTGVSATDFTVLPPGPTIVSVSPRSGSVNGGVLVTITGSDFRQGVSVTFGGVMPAAYARIDNYTINATPHPHAAGAVDVTVTNLDGSSATLTNGYLYRGPVDPNNDGQISASDIVMLVNYLFGKGPAPSGNGDANGDLVINVQDVFFLVNYLFANGRPPA